VANSKEIGRGAKRNEKRKKEKKGGKGEEDSN